MVWDVATFRPRPPLETAGSGLLGFTPDGRTLVAGPHDLPADQKRAFTRCGVETGKLSPTPEVKGPRDVMCGRLSRDGRTVYLMSYDRPEARLGAYDAVTGADRFSDQGHVALVWSMAFRPDGRMLASGGTDGRVCLWDLGTQPDGFAPPARRLTGPGPQVWSVAFSPDGRLLASGGVDGSVRVWDVATGQVVPELCTDATQAPAAVAFSPDGLTLASGSGEPSNDVARGEVQLWDVRTGQHQVALKGNTKPVLSVAFSPDGRWLAAGDLSGWAHLIDRASGRVHTFRLGRPVVGLAFSPDSQTLSATGGGPDPPVRLWDLATKTGPTLDGHTRPVPGLAFDPGGLRVATTSLDGTVRLWGTAPSVEPSRKFDFGHIGPTAGVAVTPSGRHLAVALGNGLIAVLRTPPDPAR
jgi:WD40 repeat protein